MANKIISIVGARPNFIKLSSLDNYLRKYFNHMIVHTGQHYDYELSKIFFEQLSIPEPDYYLNVGSGSHGFQVGEIIKRTEEVLVKEQPDLVIVYGDTNSTLAGALAAVKAGFKVAHVEAGLRCFDMSMPEEVNRRIVDHVSHLLFAPTLNAFANLVRECVPGRIFFTGDVHVDVLARWSAVADEKSAILKRLNLKHREYIVVTVHRAENTDVSHRLKRIAELIAGLAKHTRIIFPIHPKTRNKLMELGLFEGVSISATVTQPLGYLDFIKLLKHAKLVVTDSGGVQREAYLLKVPVIVLRNRTEWVELVEAGWAKLLEPTKPLESLIDEIISFNPEKYIEGLLGDSKASYRIVEILERYLKGL